jgi:voltage-gated potassium channel
VLRVRRATRTIENEVLREGLSLGLLILSSLFLWAGIFQIVENSYRVDDLPFHHAVFFAVVSCTTVGYGDITPESDLGRLVVVLMLLWSLLQVRWDP